MILKRTLLSGISALVIGFGGALGVANAQDEAAPEIAPMEAPAGATQDVSEDKLKSFAVAFLEVSKITQTYQPQLQAAAGSPEDEQRIREEAGAQMMQAVDASEGISVDEYNMIIQAAQVDPELAQRINGHITEVATSDPSLVPEQPAEQPVE